MNSNRLLQGILMLLLVLVLLFAPVQAAYGAQSSMGNHSMGMWDDEGNESGSVQDMAGTGSGSGITALLPILYGLFAVVIILVLVILYVVFIRPRYKADKTGADAGINEFSEIEFPAGLNAGYTDAVLIGKGGLSYVYSARSKETGERVALKIPANRDEKSGRIFLQEIRIWEELSHPNIVRLRSVNVFPVPYAEMEYIPDSLETLEKPVESYVAILIAAGVLRGLSYAHKKGIIHCDIKPGNILLDSELTPKIADWGVGRSGSSGGMEYHGYTPAFAAPEQLSPGISCCTEKTDIFQVGMLIIRMLCGKSAFERNFGKSPDAYLADCIENERLRSVISKCVSEDPDERYESADELLSEILSLSGNTIIG